MEQTENKSTGLKHFWNAYLKGIVLNKYIVVLTFFGIMLLFVSDYSVLNRMKNRAEIRRLESEIAIKRKQIEQDQKRINELKSSRDNLEKFAREHFLMKKKDEVIYLIEE